MEYRGPNVKRGDPTIPAPCAARVECSGSLLSPEATAHNEPGLLMERLRDALASRGPGPYGIPELLTNARRFPSGDHDGTLIVPCPPYR